MFDYLGVAARNPHSCLARGVPHGAYFRLQHRRRQSSFEHVGDDHGFGFRA